MKYIFYYLVAPACYMFTFSWWCLLYSFCNLCIFIYHLDFKHFICFDNIDFSFIVNKGKRFAYEYKGPYSFILGKYSIVKKDKNKDTYQNYPKTQA
jgi:hypothetical protein